MNELPSRSLAAGSPSVASALGMTSAVRRGVPLTGLLMSSGTSM